MYRENLKRYWKEQIVHAAVGALAGFLLMTGKPWAGFTLMGTVWTRQGLEWANRRDSVGIDLAYHLGGLVAGILFVMWILAGGRRK